MVKVNCETDFIAKEGEFKDFVNAVAQCVLAQRPADVDGLGNAAMSTAVLRSTNGAVNSSPR